MNLLNVGLFPTIPPHTLASMVLYGEGATPIRLIFWGSVGPTDIKPAAVRSGACVATQQPGACAVTHESRPGGRVCG